MQHMSICSARVSVSVQFCGLIPLSLSRENPYPKTGKQFSYNLVAQLAAMCIYHIVPTRAETDIRMIRISG